MEAVRNALKPLIHAMPDAVQARLETDGGLIAAGIAVLVILLFLLILFVAFLQLVMRGKKKA
jgi:CHASE3 domain sensor protein